MYNHGLDEAEYWMISTAFSTHSPTGIYIMPYLRGLRISSL